MHLLVNGLQMSLAPQYSIGQGCDAEVKRLREHRFSILYCLSYAFRHLLMVSNNILPDWQAFIYPPRNWKSVRNKSMCPVAAHGYILLYFSTAS